MDHPSVNIESLTNLLIEFSSGCNLRCRWCSLDHNKARVFLDLDLFDNILTQVANNEFPSLAKIDLHNGGETLLHPQFDEAMKILAAKKLNVPVSLLTNGVKLNSDIVDSLLLGKPVNEVRVSLDGGTPELFEYIRRGAKWEQVYRNVKEFASNRNRIDQGVSLGIICMLPVGTPAYWDLMTPEFLEILKMADSVDLRYPHGWDGSLNGVDGIVVDSTKRRSDVCYFLSYQCVVMASGEVTVCCIDLNGKNIVGNAALESLASIYTGPKRVEKIEMFLNGKANDIEGCSKCQSYWG